MLHRGSVVSKTMMTGMMTTGMSGGGDDADGTALLDLDYDEDSNAGTDMNIVMTGSGKLIEVQGTAEGEPFSREELDQLLDLGGAGCAELTQLQKEALAA
mgnify:CR=1 FL=1